MRDLIRAELTAIEPLDALEREDLFHALAWLASGADLCRVAKPATPPTHLVSYFAVVDADRIFLVDHRNAPRRVGRRGIGGRCHSGLPERQGVSPSGHQRVTRCKLHREVKT